MDAAEPRRPGFALPLELSVCASGTLCGVIASDIAGDEPESGDVCGTTCAGRPSSGAGGNANGAGADGPASGTPVSGEYASNTPYCDRRRGVGTSVRVASCSCAIVASTTVADRGSNDIDVHAARLASSSAASRGVESSSAVRCALSAGPVAGDGSVVLARLEYAELMGDGSEPTSPHSWSHATAEVSASVQSPRRETH